MARWRYIQHENYRPKPPKVEGVISASAGVLHWSRWVFENEAQFRGRVLEEATRLGVKAVFSEDKYGNNRRD